jgi:hypothetical protein
MHELKSGCKPCTARAMNCYPQIKLHPVLTTRWFQMSISQLTENNIFNTPAVSLSQKCTVLCKGSWKSRTRHCVMGVLLIWDLQYNTLILKAVREAGSPSHFRCSSLSQWLLPEQKHSVHTLIGWASSMSLPSIVSTAEMKLCSVEILNTQAHRLVASVFWCLVSCLSIPPAHWCQD